MATILEKLPKNTTKLQALIGLAQAYGTQRDTLILPKYALEALRLAERLQERKSKTDALHIMGIYYHLINKEVEALSFFQQALDLSRSIRYQKGLTRGLFWVGESNMIMTNHGQALKAWFEYIDSLEEDTTQRANVARTYNMIGKVYELPRKSDKLLEF